MFSIIIYKRGGCGITCIAWLALKSARHGRFELFVFGATYLELEIGQWISGCLEK